MRREERNRGVKGEGEGEEERVIERSSVVSRRGAIFYPYIKRVMTAAIVNMYFFLLIMRCCCRHASLFFLSIYLYLLEPVGHCRSV